jgi:hypothetical protein
VVDIVKLLWLLFPAVRGKCTYDFTDEKKKTPYFRGAKYLSSAEISTSLVQFIFKKKLIKFKQWTSFQR